MKTNLLLLVFILILLVLVYMEPGMDNHSHEYLTDLDPQSIKHISIERRELDTITLKKTRSGWKMLEPFSLDANPLRIETIIALAQKTSYTRFSALDRDLSIYQLSPPLIRISLNDTLILLGGEDPIKHQRYALVDETIHLINAMVYYQLRANLDNFISPHILPRDAVILKILYKNNPLDGQLFQHWQRFEASQIETVHVESADATLEISIQNAEKETQQMSFWIQQMGTQVRISHKNVPVSYFISDKQFALAIGKQ